MAKDGIAIKASPTSCFQKALRGKTGKKRAPHKGKSLGPINAPATTTFHKAIGKKVKTKKKWRGGF